MKSNTFRIYSITRHLLPLRKNEYHIDNKRCHFWTEATDLVLNFSGYSNWSFHIGKHSTIIASDYCKFETGDDCVFNIGSDNKVKTGNRCTFDANSDNTFETEDNCTFNVLSSNTFKTGKNCTFRTFEHCKFETGDDCLFSIYNINSCKFSNSSHVIDRMKKP